MKKKIIIALIAIIVIAIATIYIMIRIDLKEMEKDLFEINETKYVVSSRQVEFRIDYEYSFFPDPEYFAAIYINSRTKPVGYVKLDELYETNGENLVNPDPQFKEIYYSDSLQCYMFFNYYLIYCYYGDYGSIRTDEIKGINRYNNLTRDLESFIPVAEILADADIDSELKALFLRFLGD